MTTTRALPSPPRLVGDLAVWLIILAEMLAFCILFLQFLFQRAYASIGFVKLFPEIGHLVTQLLDQCMKILIGKSLSC